MPRKWRPCQGHGDHAKGTETMLRAWKQEVPIHGSRVAMLRGSRAVRRWRCGRFEKLRGQKPRKKRKGKEKRKEEGICVKENATPIIVGSKINFILNGRWFSVVEFKQVHYILFLVASTRHYKLLCRLVRWSVCSSVGCWLRGACDLWRLPLLNELGKNSFYLFLSER